MESPPARRTDADRNACPYLGQGALTDHDSVPVTHVETGLLVWIRRIRNERQLDRDTRFGLRCAGVTPGMNIRLERVSADGSVLLQAPRRSIVVARGTADRIEVVPTDLGALSERLLRSGRPRDTDGAATKIAG